VYVCVRESECEHHAHTLCRVNTLTHTECKPHAHTLCRVNTRTHTECVAVCGSVWQCAAVCCSVLHMMRNASQHVATSVLQCVAVCGSVWQCVAVCGSVLQRVAYDAECIATCCNECIAMCCSVLQCAAVCCSVLQSHAHRLCRVRVRASIHTLTQCVNERVRSESASLCLHTHTPSADSAVRIREQCVAECCSVLQ